MEYFVFTLIGLCLGFILAHRLFCYKCSKRGQKYLEDNKINYIMGLDEAIENSDSWSKYGSITED